MKKYYEMVEKNKDLILEAEKYLWENPEPGYKEFKTNKYVLEHFKKLGYELVEAENITGFYTVLDTGKPGPTVLVIAELDSLINRTHPACDKETGAVHSCGHHTQCASMMGLASALKEEGAIEGLSGKIKLCLVPAEEGIEIGYRKDLVKKGIIEFTSGKPEFIARRFFDDVDLAFMVHCSPRENCNFVLTKGHNGVIRKCTTVIGKSAHAGGSPQNGINALNAASLIITAVNSLRETFEEKHYARVHSIITKGGDAVNAVPDEVVIESYVRAAETKAHKKVNDAVNRAISASAAAIGCTVRITDMAGSEALIENADLREMAREIAEDIGGEGAYRYEDKWYASSTDMGDISTLFPTMHAYATGAVGTTHGVDYFIENPYNACVNSAKLQFAMIRKLLENNAEKAKEVIKNFTPTFNSVDEYLAHKRALNMDKETVIFNQDGTITLDYKN